MYLTWAMDEDYPNAFGNDNKEFYPQRGNDDPSSDSNIALESDPEMAALMTAIKAGNLEEVRTLITHGTQINVESSRISPLIEAIKCYHYAPSAKDRKTIVYELIKAGANVNTYFKPTHSRKCYTMIPIIIATQTEDEELITALIDAGANVNAADDCRRTALSVAADRGYQAIVKTLLKSSSINSETIQHARTRILEMREGFNYPHWNSKILTLLNKKLEKNCTPSIFTKLTKSLHQKTLPFKFN